MANTFIGIITWTISIQTQSKVELYKNIQYNYSGSTFSVIMNDTCIKHTDAAIYTFISDELRNRCIRIAAKQVTVDKAVPTHLAPETGCYQHGCL